MVSVKYTAYPSQDEGVINIFLFIDVALLRTLRIYFFAWLTNLGKVEDELAEYEFHVNSILKNYSYLF